MVSFLVMLGQLNLNKDQLDGLAGLCFDLAKGSLAISVLSPLGSSNILVALNGVRGVVIGIVFTYIALVLLRAKEKVI